MSFLYGNFSPIGCLFWGVVILLGVSACDTTSNMQSPTRVQKKLEVRQVIVPYQTSFGPWAINDMTKGFVKHAPQKSRYKKESVPPPSPFGCLTSRINKNPKSKHDYRYGTKFLYFSKWFVDLSHGRFKYVVTSAASPKAPDGEIMAMTRCAVPFNNLVDELLERDLKSFVNRNHPGVKVTMKTESWELTPEEYND